MSGEGGGRGEGYWERWVRKRKSWVSSVRSVSAGGWPLGRGLSSSRSAIFGRWGYGGGSGVVGVWWVSGWCGGLILWFLLWWSRCSAGN